MQIHNCEQGTSEWFEVRKGKMTASNAQAIGNNGKGLETYIHKIMAEYYSTGEKESFANKHTERGNELESVARDLYEMETGLSVLQVGFISYNKYVGCSPDGLIKKEGGAEIKCKDDPAYLRMLLYREKEIDSGHMWQMQMNLLITQRKWWDYIVYNPNFKESLIIIRVYPDPKKFEALLKGFEAGQKMIKNIKKILDHETKKTRA